MLDISSTELLVLLCLADHENEYTGQCNPPSEMAADECKLNEKTVRNALHSLERKSLITLMGFSGRAYRINFHLPDLPVEAGATGSDQDLSFDRQTTPANKPRSRRGFPVRLESATAQGAPDDRKQGPVWPVTGDQFSRQLPVRPGSVTDEPRTTQEITKKETRIDQIRADQIDIAPDYLTEMHVQMQGLDSVRLAAENDQTQCDLTDTLNAKLPAPEERIDGLPQARAEAPVEAEAGSTLMEATDLSDNKPTGPTHELAIKFLGYLGNTLKLSKRGLEWDRIADDLSRKHEPGLLTAALDWIYSNESPDRFWREQFANRITDPFIHFAKTAESILDQYQRWLNLTSRRTNQGGRHEKTRNPAQVAPPGRTSTVTHWGR